MSEAMITVLVCPVEGAPRAEAIPNTLEGLQAVVGGGYVQQVSVRIRGRVFDLLCDEDGVHKGLPYNATVSGHELHGTFFMAKSEGEEFASLSTEDVAVLVSALC